MDRARKGDLSAFRFVDALEFELGYRFAGVQDSRVGALNLSVGAAEFVEHLCSYLSLQFFRRSAGVKLGEPQAQEHPFASDVVRPHDSLGATDLVAAAIVQIERDRCDLRSKESGRDAHVAREEGEPREVWLDAVHAARNVTEDILPIEIGNSTQRSVLVVDGIRCVECADACSTVEVDHHVRNAFPAVV